MKIDCVVTSVANSGETMSISLKGNQPKDADWRPTYYQEIEVVCSDKLKKAFYLGRRVTITVEPK